MQNRHWYVSASGLLGTFNEIYAIEGDTTVNGQSYPLLVLKDTLGNRLAASAMVNEDTSAGLVELYTLRNGKDTMRYDFSVSVGDTLSNPGYASGNLQHFVVDSVFSITDLQAVSRKVIWLYGADPKQTCYQQLAAEWIEGLGADGLTDFPTPDCGVVPEGVSSITCVFDSISQIYGDTSAACVVLGQGEIGLPQMTVYPNPVSDVLYWEHGLAIREVEIYGATGRRVQRGNFSVASCDLTRLRQGLYFLIFTDAEGWQYQARVIKE